MTNARVRSPPPARLRVIGGRNAQKHEDVGSHRHRGGRRVVRRDDVHRGSGGHDWNSAGGNLQNTRFQANEKTLSVSNVDELEVKWEFTTGGDVSATPAVVGDTVYFPDRAGSLYAVDKWTGAAAVERRRIAAASGVPGRLRQGHTRDRRQQGHHRHAGPLRRGGKVLAFDKDTGSCCSGSRPWTRTRPRSSPSRPPCSATGSTSARRRSRRRFALIPGYDCCSFRGQMAALDLNTGAIVWQIRMAPEGFPGNAVWGSSPGDRPQARSAVHRHREQLRRAARDPRLHRRGRRRPRGAAGVPAGRQPLRLDHGPRPEDGRRSVGSTRALGFDAWTVDCIPFLGEGTNCPEPAGPTSTSARRRHCSRSRWATRSRTSSASGQKSGQYWALDPDTGAVRWVTQAGPGGTAGGLQWGSAVDDRRVYTADANSNAIAVDAARRHDDHHRRDQRHRRRHRRAAVADDAAVRWDPVRRRCDLRSADDGERRGLLVRARLRGAHVRVGRRHRRDPVDLRQRRLMPLGSGDLGGSAVLGVGLLHSSARRTTSSTPSAFPADAGRPLWPAGHAAARPAGALDLATSSRERPSPARRCGARSRSRRPLPGGSADRTRCGR